jgi:site-specific recombinase XerD
MASLRKVGLSYYIRYRVNYRQFEKKIGHKITKATAHKILREFEEKLALQKVGINTPESITYKEFFKDYLIWVKSNQAKNTYSIKCSARKRFEEFLEKEFNTISQIQQFTTQVIEKYKLHRLGQGKANRTINIELNFISNTLVMAEEWGYLVPNIKIRRLKEDKKLPRYFSKDEVSRMISNSSKHLKQVITISIYTGLRINELLNLKWENIDFENNVIKVIQSATFKTKNRRERYVPIHPNLRTYLVYLRNHFIDPQTDKVSTRNEEQQVYILCSKYGFPIKCVRKSFVNLLRKLNIKNTMLHTLRHTFASMCVMNNVDLYTIKEFLGHSKITTTEIYTHINQTHKHSSIQKINILEN